MGHKKKSDLLKERIAARNKKRDKKRKKKEKTMPNDDEVQTSTLILSSTINNSLKNIEIREPSETMATAVKIHKKKEKPIIIAEFFKQLSTDEVRDLLVLYLTKHDSRAVKHADKVINHFEGKMMELEKKFTLKYGESIQDFDSKRRSNGAIEL